MMRYYIFLLWIILAMSSCQKDEGALFGDQVSHQFFMESNGAFMPVFVEGNTNSKTFMLVLHGGPGGNSLIYKNVNAFEAVQEQYAVVYFDQRCAGNSQGNCDPNSLTVAEHTRDVDKMVELLKYKYGQDISIILLGHSWGGTLALSYLVDKDFQQKLSAAVIVAGPHKFDIYRDYVAELIEFYADQQIGLDNEVTAWNELLTDIRASESNTVAGINAANSAAMTAQTLMSNVDSVSAADITSSELLSNIFSPPNNSLSNLINQLSSGPLWEKLLIYDLTDSLQNIDLPIALWWGRYDFVVPRRYGEEIRELVSSEVIEYREFEFSEHSPMLTQKSTFNLELLSFINAYK